MRRLGAELRKIREALGLSLDDAAVLLMLSRSALSRMENAQVIIRPREVEYAVIKYGVTDEDLHESLLGLASAGRSRDWVKRYRTIAPGPVVGDYFRMEQDSTRIRAFHPTLIYGLLQIPDYALSVMQARQVDPARDYAKSVAFRMARREVLTRPDPARLDVVIGEAALRQRTASPDIMRQQLFHLQEVSRSENRVTVRVLPFGVRSPFPGGAFTLLDVMTGNFIVAMIETLRRNLFVEEDEDILEYQSTFEALNSVALDEAGSRDLIERVITELWSPGGEHHDHLAEE